MYEYGAVVTKVVDGDTVHAQVDLGCDVRINLTIRLAGIDTPELPTTEGLAAKAWLQARLDGLGGKVVLRTVKDRRERYGRYLGTLVAADGADINAEMVAAGLAVPYGGGLRI